jgi:putative SOS response-associated peptidase YedK
LETIALVIVQLAFVFAVVGVSAYVAKSYAVAYIRREIAESTEQCDQKIRELEARATARISEMADMIVSEALEASALRQYVQYLLSKIATNVEILEFEKWRALYSPRKKAPQTSALHRDDWMTK